VNIQAELERCYPLHCLCSLRLADMHEYLNKFAYTVANLEEDDLAAVEDELMVAVSSLMWLGDSCHDQLVSGRVCSAIQAVVAHLLRPGGSFLLTLLKLIKVILTFRRSGLLFRTTVPVLLIIAESNPMESNVFLYPNQDKSMVRILKLYFNYIRQKQNNG
jgi:hypothetical protein